MVLEKTRVITALLAASVATLLSSLIVLFILHQTTQPLQGSPPSGGSSAGTRAGTTPNLPGQADGVAVFEVKKSGLPSRAVQPGIVEPAAQVDVLPAVSGMLGSIAVDIGQKVGRGEPLATVRTSALAFDVARAEAVVEEASSRVRTARSLVPAVEAEVAGAEAELQAADAQLDLARSTASYRKQQHERLAALVKKGLVDRRVAGEEEDRMRASDSEIMVAAARVAVRRAGLENTRAKLVNAGAEVDRALAGLHLAELDLQKTRALLESSTIVAPIAGVVTRRYRHVGEYVRAAGGDRPSPIVRIVQTGAVRIVARVPDRDARLVTPGATASFRPDAVPGRLYRGKVARTSVAQDAHSHTMRAEVDLDNADGGLRPGQAGRLAVELGAARDVFLVPASALTNLRDGQGDLFRISGGRAVRSTVQLGATDPEMGQVEVVAGLKDGDTVLLHARDAGDGPRIERDGTPAVP